MKTRPTVPAERPEPLASALIPAGGGGHSCPVLFALVCSFKSLQSIYGDEGCSPGASLWRTIRDIARPLPIVQITLNTLTVAVIW